jgi:hypothetical protein
LSRNILTPALLTAPISSLYFRTAPEGSLLGIVPLLCLPETPVGFWGRSNGSERMEFRLKRDTPLRPTMDKNRSIWVEIKLRRRAHGLVSHSTLIRDTGEQNPERGSFVRDALHVDGAVMCLNGLFHYGKPQSCPHDLAGLFVLDPVKFVKDLG